MPSRSGAVPTPRAPIRGALITQSALVAAISLRWTFGVTPDRWVDDHCAGGVGYDSPGVLHTALHDFVERTPIAALDARFDLWIFAAVICLSVIVCRGGLSLFRGPSRALASVIAALLASESAWAIVTSNDSPPVTTLANLLFSIITMLGVFAIIQALVRHGKVTGRAFVHTIAAAMWLALIDVHAGIIMGGLLIAAAVTRRFKGKRRSVSPIPWKTVLLLGGFASLVVVATSWLEPRWMSPLFDAPAPAQIHVESLRHAPPGFLPRLYLPAWALLLVLIAPLRWRGGLTMIVITTASIIVTCRGEPIAGGLPAACLLSVCAGGWIWLAGTFTRNVPLAQTFASVAAVGLLLWANLGAAWTDGARLQRPTTSLLRLVERGLAAPRDVVFLVHPSVRAQLQHLQRRHGVRPDLVIRSVDDFSDETLVPAVVSWNAAGQRLLSDSFSLEGRWDARWAIESGPLYWFIFDGERVRQAPSIASHTSLVDLALEARPPFALMQLERARYRRSLGRYELAGRSLAIIDPELMGISTAVAAAEQTRIPSNHATMLRAPTTAPHSWPLKKIVHESNVEAGDLLFHLGSIEQGELVLYRAGLDGASRAWSPLLSWLSVSGQRERTNAIYAQLMSLPGGMCEALRVLTSSPQAAIFRLPSVEALFESAALERCDRVEVFSAKLLSLARK